MALPDRYPGADILAQRGHWDDATRRVVLDRVHNVPPYRYFTPHQQATLEAFCARILPQDHRPQERRIAIAPWIDQLCQERREPGFRYEDLPPVNVAWEWGLEGLDQAARALFGPDFATLGPAAQDEVLEAVRAGNPPGEAWTRLNVNRWWRAFALNHVVGIYYAHPYAWDEIGYGGPAYPRGYFALNGGYPEPWEPREVPTEIEWGPGGPEEQGGGPFAAGTRRRFRWPWSPRPENALPGGGAKSASRQDQPDRGSSDGHQNQQEHTAR